MENPLFQDLTVIELASVLAGPAASMYFAENGAEVIKIENPDSGGDVTRQWKTENEPPNEDLSSYFSSVNWGKKSIALDLKTKAGLQVLYDLVRSADIVVTSYKPGDSEKLGVDHETLRQYNPQIIYGAITGFGNNDDRVGYDAIIQAQAGFTYMNGQPYGPPTKMPVALMDLLAAHQLKEGLLTALIKRMKTGEGSFITTSLLQAGITSLANQATNWLVGGEIPERQGSEHPNIFPYGGIFYTRDQYPIVLAIGNDRQFEKLCQILDLPGIAKDPAYQTNQERVKNRDALRPILAKAIQNHDRAFLIREFNEAQIPAGGVLNMEEVFEQDAAKTLLLNDQGLKGIRTIAYGDGRSANPNLPRPPHFGQDTNAILSGFLNYEQAFINKLNAQAVIHLNQQESR